MQPEDVEVTYMSDIECEEAVRSALANLGCSADELNAQAKRGFFDSEQHKRVWFAIADML